MDSAPAFPLADLAPAFLESNLSRLWLSDRARQRIAAAEPRGEVLHQADGTPVLCHEGTLLGTPPDDLALNKSVRAAPKGSTFVVFGLGCGHTPRALRALTDAPIVIYEPDAGLCRQALGIGPSDLGAYPIACSTYDLAQLWQGFSSNRNHVTLITTPGYESLFERENSDLREALTQLVQRRFVNDATHRVRAREWISDVLENVELLAEHPTFLGLAEKYQGVPAFIVGAGPSLGKNGELLADAAKKGIVFAVNSSALALAKRGVTPQVVACMESIDLSRLLASIPYLNQVVRAFSLTAHPSTLRTGSGPLLPVYEALSQFTPLSSLVDAKGLALCGSVSTLAFSLAQRLGCSPIVLVGQDLAYTGGQAYASGTPYEGSAVKVSDDGQNVVHERSSTLEATNKALPASEPLRSVAAWGGEGSVHSTIAFSAVRHWLEQSAELLRVDRPEQRLINATEGGAHVAGFEELSLAEVLRDLPERPISADDIARAARETRPPVSRARLEAWVGEQLSATRAARRAAQRLRRLARAAQLALQKDEPRLVRRTFSKLEQGERELRECVGKSPFVDGFSWADVDAVMQPSARGDDSRINADLAMRTEAQLAQAIETSSRELETRLERLAHSFGARAP